jgi:hypothetical protein
VDRGVGHTVFEDEGERVCVWGCCWCDGRGAAAWECVGIFWQCGVWVFCGEADSVGVGIGLLGRRKCWEI